MIDRPATEQLLRRHFDVAADPNPTPGQMDRVMAAAARTRQRHPWEVQVRRGVLIDRPAAAARALRHAWLLALLVLVAVLVAGAILASRLLPPSIPPVQPGLLAVTRDGDLYLVDPVTRDERLVLHPDGVSFSDPAWAADGRIRVSTDDDGIVLVDPRTAEATRVPGLDAGATLAWSPGGSDVAIVDGQALLVLDIASGVRRVLLPAPAGAGVWTLAWSPDGGSIAANIDGQLALIRASSGEVTVLEQARPLGTEDLTARMRSFSSGALEPSWSPDSTRLAFTRWDCGSMHCFDPGAITVIRADGTGAHQLTTFDPSTSDPGWSPDGDWIAFSSEPEHEIWNADRTSARVASELWVMRPDGSDRHALVADAVAEFAWDPDGKGLTYTRIAQADDPAQEVWRIGVMGTEPRQIGVTAEGFGWQSMPADAAPARLPTASRSPGVIDSRAPPLRTPPPARAADPSRTWSGIAYFEDIECAVRVVRFDGAPEPPLHAGGCPIDGFFMPSVAPDGSAFVVDTDTTATVVPTGGGAPWTFDRAEASNFLRWAEDSRHLLETHCAQTPCGVDVISRDGSMRRPLEGPATWSADGTRMAVQAGPDGVLSGAGDGSRLRPIGTFPWPITWSPDGSRFAYVRDGNAWTAGPDGSEARQVTDFDLGGVRGLAWSPDGTRIAVLRGTMAWVYPAVGGAGERLALPDGPYAYTKVRWSPDGSLLAIGAEAAPGAPQLDWPPLFLVAPGEPSGVLLHDLEEPLWSPDGAILAATDRDGQLVVMRADGSGRRTLGVVSTVVKAWRPAVAP